MFKLGPPTPKINTTPKHPIYKSDNPTPAALGRSQSYVDQSKLIKQAKVDQQRRNELEQQAEELKNRLNTLA